MIVHDAWVAGNGVHQLGEGPAWDDAARRLLWVDVAAGTVYIGRLDDDRVVEDARLEFGDTVGAVVPSSDGGLLVAGARTLHRVSPAGAVTAICDVIAAEVNSRLNDGACDPAGRFLAGTLCLGGPPGEEILCQLRADDLSTIDDDLSLSNGLGWSPDGHHLYSVDSTPGTVWTRPYDPLTGRTGERRVLFRVPDGEPDGLCVDVDGHLWIAVWGAAEVRRYTLAGEIVAKIMLPAPHVTSVAFVGPERRTLLITTAREGLSTEQLERHPLSGRLFLSKVDVTGVPTAPWAVLTEHSATDPPRRATPKLMGDTR